MNSTNNKSKPPPPPTTADIDQPFKSVTEVKKHQKSVATNTSLRLYEQEWSNRYFTPFTELMGHNLVQKYLGIERTKQALRGKPPVNHPCIYFTGGNKEGAEGHWLARRSGEVEVFDPYEEVQINGTMQFCQTFATMYSLGPGVIQWSSDRTFNRFYNYTQQALLFIRGVIQRLPASYSFYWINKVIEDDEAEAAKKEGRENNFELGLSSDNATAKRQMLTLIEESIRHPYACLNLSIIKEHVTAYDVPTKKSLSPKFMNEFNAQQGKNGAA